MYVSLNTETGERNQAHAVAGSPVKVAALQGIKHCKERLPLQVKILRFLCPHVDVHMHQMLKFLLLLLELERI